MNMNLIGTLAIVIISASSAFAAPRCDEQSTFTSPSGQQLINCRIDGEAARNLYNRTQADAVAVPDADGGLSQGYTKEDEYTYCFANRRLTVFQCSITLDAATGEQLPLDASIN